MDPSTYSHYFPSGPYIDVFDERMSILRNLAHGNRMAKANWSGIESMTLTSLMCLLDQENDPICLTNWAAPVQAE